MMIVWINLQVYYFSLKKGVDSHMMYVSSVASFNTCLQDGIESESLQFIWNNITIKNTSFHNNVSPESGGAISLMYFSRVDQITNEAVISNWYVYGTILNMYWST